MTFWSVCLAVTLLTGGGGNDVMFGGLPIGTRDDYQLNTDDFTLPPQYTETEASFSSSLASFGLRGISTGGYVPAVLVTQR